MKNSRPGQAAHRITVGRVPPATAVAPLPTNSIGTSNLTISPQTGQVDSTVPAFSTIVEIRPWHGALGQRRVMVMLRFIVQNSMARRNLLDPGCNHGG
jgi:hypothetical protein